jgi:hypothetical protein
MHARDARKITDAALAPAGEGPVAGILKQVYERIKLAAQQGKRELCDPVEHVARAHSWMSSDYHIVVNAAYESLKQQGYLVSYLAGDQRERGYHTVSW